MSKIEDRVKEAIAEALGVDKASIVPEASFIEDLGADSLSTVELVMSLEDRFKVEIPDEESQKILTVRDAIEYIHKHSVVEENE